MPAETEKISINMTPVDLGKIDLLVSEGLYTSRTDFIRSATRKLLDDSSAVVQQAATRQEFAWGAMHYTVERLEERRARHERLRIRVVGLVRIAADVSPELADAVFEELHVLGVLRAPKAVLDRLGARVRREGPFTGGPSQGG